METEVIEGNLVCRNCGHEYKIKEGIANFLLPNHLGESNLFIRQPVERSTERRVLTLCISVIVRTTRTVCIKGVGIWSGAKSEQRAGIKGEGKKQIHCQPTDASSPPSATVRRLSSSAT